MRWFLSFLVLAFVVTLVAVAGVRASREGAAFTLGMACGGAASVPASMLALYLVRRAEPAQQQQEKRPAYPPVMIVNGPMPQREQPLPDFPPLRQPEAPTTSGPRYRVIGEK